MGTIIFILILIGLAIILFFLVSNWLKCRQVLRIQKKNNVIVFGHKGKGKDLIFQYFINKRKEPYYSNCDYGGEFRKDSLLNLSTDNDYNDFINDTIKIAKKDEDREGLDTYISDGGVYLPSNHDTALHKRYKGMPIFYALSRHLYNSNVHVNVQNLERLWKALREQADYYIKANGVIKLPFLLIVKACAYENYNDALQGLKPLKKRILDKNESKTHLEIANSSRGEIKPFFIIMLKKHIYYDTREFHKIIFGYPANENHTTHEPTNAEQPSNDFMPM